MSWHRIDIGFDGVMEGAGSRLQREVSTRFAERGVPEDAALFQRPLTARGSSYFLSPAAAALAPDVVQRWHGQACEPPPPDGLLFLAGNSDAPERLLAKREGVE